MEKKFTILSKNGEQGTITISNIKKGGFIEFEIVKLEIKNNVIVENVQGVVSYLTTDNNVYITFKQPNKDTINFLDITKNKEIIDYLWENNGRDKYSCIYQFTTDHWRNWED